MSQNLTGYRFHFAALALLSNETRYIIFNSQHFTMEGIPASLNPPTPEILKKIFNVISELYSLCQCVDNSDL